MKKTKKMYQLVSWVLVLGWMGVIFYLSHQSASESSGLSTSLLSYLRQIGSDFLPGEEATGWLHHILRKGAHFTAYFILGVLWLNAILSTIRNFHLKYVWLAFVLSVLYAMSDEFHQLFIPGRSGEWGDVLIDSTGSLLGILTFLLLRKIVQQQRHR